jgi:very-short-patch-repair endonuclease
MAERWYQALLDVAPQLAGAIALHHGSIEQELRLWVEDALHTQKLKAVVATASLDLGVDFRPVDTVIQVGSPKGVSRFLQRAGRAGHQPGEISNVYFLPTHSLELLEAAALKEAIEQHEMESKDPLSLCYDVLCQFLCTLAVGDGFRPDKLFPIIQSSWCFQTMTQDEWLQVLMHITEGGKALQQYDEYRKVEVIEGIYKITSRRIALRHRMNIGTIVSDAMLKVKFMTGGYIGHIEEYFISRLEPGDVFTLAGRNVELVQIKDMTVLVRKTNQKKSIVPSWMGGRMSLTANLGKVLREVMGEAQLLVSQQEENPVVSMAPIFAGEGLGEGKAKSPKNQNSSTLPIEEPPGLKAPLSGGEGPGERSTDVPFYLTADKKMWPTLITHAKEMRKSPTVAEKLLWQNLRNRKLAGYKFRRQHPILYFIPDFVCLEKKLIIELDGQPHNDTEQRKADYFRACMLAEQGYRIIRFWNHDIEKNQLVVLEKIKQRLELNEDVASIQQRLRNASPVWWNEYVQVNSNEKESSKSLNAAGLEVSGLDSIHDLTPDLTSTRSDKKNIGELEAANDLTPSPSPQERGEKTPINNEENSLLTPSPSPQEREEKTPINNEENSLLTPSPSPQEREEKSIALSPELIALTPLFQLQAELSHIPRNNELLIEQHESKEGYHLLVYPFEGRQIHEAMSAILAYRISRIMPITFSIAMNDYGFELLSDKPIPVDDSNVHDLFTTDDLFIAMQQSANHVEMASRKFRDIAVIGGLIFQGMPGEQKKARHLQASASLIFRVFKEFDADNLLLRQAYQEVYEQQMEEVRLRLAFQRIQSHPIIIKWPSRFTPLSFPIIADGLNRNNLSSENLEDRIKKMAAALNR